MVPELQEAAKDPTIQVRLGYHKFGPLVLILQFRKLSG